MATAEISVVVPVYNSAEILPALYQRLHAVLSKLGKPFEVVLVDDGSPDDSWKVLQQLQRENPTHVVAIQLMRNFGQHNALMCGFRQAVGTFIITMDDDLQHPPEELPKLLAAIEDQELDLVYGAYDCKRHNQVKNIASRIVNGFYQFVFQTRVTVTSFRIIRRELLDAILSYSLNFTFVDGLLAWNTRRTAEVVVAHKPRVRRSGYRFGKLLTLALNLFTNFSLIPLQFVSGFGIMAALGGFALGAYYVLQYAIHGAAVPGFASTVVSILVLGGLQLLGLGIIGEYVGRMHLNLNRKPQYSIRRVLAPGDEAQKGASRGDRHTDSDGNYADAA